MKMTVEVKYRVTLIESERGWGQSILYYKDFETIEEANAYMKAENAKNTAKSAPDYYIYATEPVRVVIGPDGKVIN
jgi:hypothetical protein